MITPRQVSPNVQSLFASQPEFVSPSKGKKPLSGAPTDDVLIASKRSTGVLTEKNKVRGVEKTFAGGGEEDSFGAQLERAVNRKPRAEGDRKSDERRDADDARASDRAPQSERANDESSRRTESKRSEDAPDDSDGPREGEKKEEKAAELQPPALLVDSSAKLAAGDSPQTWSTGEEALERGETVPTEDAAARTRGTFVKVLAGAGSSAANAEVQASGESGYEAELLDGGATLEGTGLKLVKPETVDPRSGIAAGDDLVSGDAEALRAAALGVDANADEGKVDPASTPIEELKTVGVRGRGQDVERTSENSGDAKLIDQRAEIVSRTSRLAALKAQPLTIDSLNELLVTIDPSLASQILRPTSLSGATRESVAESAKDVRLPSQPERSEMTPVDVDIVELQAESDETARERIRETSGIASRREVSTAGDRGSFSERVLTRQTEADSTSKPATEQRQGDALRERGSSESVKSPQTSASAGGMLNVLNVAGVSVGSLSDSPRGESKTGTAGDGTVKTQTIAAGPTTLGGASGSATNQGSRDEQGSSLLQQSASFRSLTDDVEGNRVMNAAVASQLTRGVSTALRQRVGSMVMKLQPESLGQVRVNIDFASTTLNVRFDTASAQASQAIQSAMSELKASLVSRGYSLGQARVTIDPTLSDSLRTGEAAVSNQAIEILANNSSARSVDIPKATTNRESVRQLKQKAEKDSLEREGGRIDAEELLTVDARGEVVRTKLSAVG